MRNDEPITTQRLLDTERDLLQRIATVWSRGWQPRELERLFRRSSLGEHELLRLAIAADRLQWSASALDPRWRAQLDALDLPSVNDHGWLATWFREAGPTQRSFAVLELILKTLEVAAPMPVLIPPPGGSVEDGRTINLTEKTDDPILNRVRALLAQAESTTFEAEAETFTAKAQEMMTRHAIDIAMVAAGSKQTNELPGAIRIPIDPPYVNAKWTLFNVVAESSRCRAVFGKRLGLATAIGFDADVRATETLYTSLLVQSQVALRAATAAAAPGDPERTRTFKSSFLLAYAYRVGERLEEINARVAATAAEETGRDIFPVLAARSAQVDRRVEEIYPRLGTFRSRAMVDPEGWASGRMAADRARLNAGDLTRAKRALHAG